MADLPVIGGLVHGDDVVQALLVTGAFTALVIHQMGQILTQTAVHS